MKKLLRAFSFIEVLISLLLWSMACLVILQIALRVERDMMNNQYRSIAAIELVNAREVARLQGHDPAWLSRIHAVLPRARVTRTPLRICWRVEKEYCV